MDTMLRDLKFNTLDMYSVTISKLLSFVFLFAGGREEAQVGATVPSPNLTD